MKFGNSFLQAVFRSLCTGRSGVQKKPRRDAAVLTAGVAIVTVVAFMASVYQGGSRNSLVAFAETHQETGQEERKTEDKDRTSGVSDRKEEIPESEMQSTGMQSPRTEGAGSGADKKKPVLREPAERGEDKAALKAAQGFAYSGDDYQVLLKIVQAEAGGCDIKGRILVANVILNRVKSKEFPDSITDVVFERSQFSPVSSGTIHTCRVTKETTEAVDRALAGEDYSQGALYFMNRRGSTGKNISWFDNHLDYLFQYGNHEFFK